MRCRFCDQDKPALAKAHIIPRSFFKSVRGKGNYSVEMRASKKAVKEKFHQAGNYDDGILCEECERKFSQYDAHGHSVFTKVFEEPKIYHDPAGIRVRLSTSRRRFPFVEAFCAKRAVAGIGI